MWIDGVSYKSLNFTVLEKQIRDFSKDQTFRTNFFPKYRINEVIAISFKKTFLYLAKVLEIYPKQIKNLTRAEAKRDGFKTLKAFREKIIEINKIKTLPLEQWGMITRFEPISFGIECFCGFIWTNKRISLGFHKDEGGDYFSCGKSIDNYEGWDDCTGYVGEVFGNGTLNKLYPKLKERYNTLKMINKKNEIRSKHKYTLEKFV